MRKINRARVFRPIQFNIPFYKRAIHSGLPAPVPTCQLHAAAEPRGSLGDHMGHLPDLQTARTSRKPPPGVFHSPVHETNDPIYGKMAGRTEMKEAGDESGSSPSNSTAATTYPKPRQIAWDELVSAGYARALSYMLCARARHHRA